MAFRTSFILMIACFLSSSCTNLEGNTGLKVFHYNQPNPITSLDPAFAKSQNNIWAVNHIFDCLVDLDTSLNVIPTLAKSWEINDSGKEYIFHLRTDVFFHPDSSFSERNRKMTASDCVYSFNRLIDPKVNSPGSWLFNGKVLDENPFVALNDSTFVIRLKKAFRPFLGILSMQYCSIVAKETVEAYGKNYRVNPIGTGPFKMKRWIENQALFLSKNEKYFLGPSDLDGVRTSFIADRKIAFLELLNGKIEFTSGLESSFINELLTADGNLQDKMKDKLQYIKSPYLNTEYLGINMELAQTSSLNNKLVRQAMNFAINRELMLKALRNNVGYPANAGFVPRGLPSFDPSKVKGYSYDPVKSKDLLVQAGFPLGEGLEEITITTNQDYIDLTTFIAKEWEKLGLKIKIELMESAVLRAGMRKSSIDLFRASWIADYPDEESFLCMFYSKNPAPPNYTRFQNEEFDRLYEKAIVENDDEQRFELYHEMDRILIEEAPVIFLFYDETALFATRNISDFKTNALNILEAYPLKHN